MRFLAVIIVALLLLVLGYKTLNVFFTNQAVDEKNSEELLNAIPADAPLSVKIKRKNDLQGAAEEAPYLEVKDCKPSPIIINVVNKPNLIVKNSGDKNITLSFGQRKYNVPSHGQISMSLDFAKGELHPWYWYTCGQPYTSGIIWVVYTYYLKPTSL